MSTYSYILLNFENWKSGFNLNNFLEFILHWEFTHFLMKLQAVIIIKCITNTITNSQHNTVENPSQLNRFEPSSNQKREINTKTLDKFYCQ